MKIQNKNIEILAPVGGKEQLIAAVRAGADAVYLGTGNFNARRNAENFSAETFDLEEAVKYCHARDVLVHVTMNTLVADDEMDAVVETVRNIAKAGADAVIVQDLAVAKILRETVPTLEIHASTQMAVHNVEGVKALEKLGFCRAVLARELSLEEIYNICQSTDMEIEVFVHGAQCMSASGLCELSAMIGGRSGNRGYCAQPCRLNFKCKGREHVLSLKDMSHIQHLPDLLECGVASVKIEGRMKRPEYVAAAVTACRNSLENKPYDIETLQAAFSRSGFTDGYLTGNRNQSMFGYRTKDDVLAAQAANKSLANLYRTERQSVGVDMEFYLEEGKNTRLTVEDEHHLVEVEGAMAETALKVAMNHETAVKNLSKTGGTQFYIREIETHLDEGLTVSPSEINRMRREALEKLSEIRAENHEKAFIEVEKAEKTVHESINPKYRLRFEKAEQVFDAVDVEKIILPIVEIERNLNLVEKYGEKLVAEIPCLAYGQRNEHIKRRLLKLKKAGLSAVYVENIGGLNIANDLGLIAHGGASLNVLNSETLEEYAKLGLADGTISIEMSAERLKNMTGEVSRGALSYGYIPLMKFRNCPAKGANGCGSCTGINTLIDRTEANFTLICRDRQYSELLNCVPLYTGNRRMSGADFLTLYFTTETKAECETVYKSYKGDAVVDFRRTGGLYHRELL